MTAMVAGNEKWPRSTALCDLGQRTAHDEFGLQLYAGEIRRAGSDGEQQFGRGLAHPVVRYLHRRQWRIRDPGQVNVVEADDGQVVGHRDAVLARLDQGAGGKHVYDYVLDWTSKRLKGYWGITVVGSFAVNRASRESLIDADHPVVRAARDLGKGLT